MEFIIMMAPAILSLAIYEQFTKKNDVWFRIQYTAIMMIVINAAVFALMYIWKGPTITFDFENKKTDTLFRFIMIYNAVAVCITLGLVGLQNMVKIKLEKRGNHEEK